MSDGMAKLVQALANNRTDESRGERWQRRVAVAGRVGAIAVFLVCVAIAGGLMWWAWQSGSWDEFYWEMLPVVPGLMMIWRVGEGRTRARRDAALRAGAQALRLWAARGDDEDAPLVEPQPAPVEGDAVAADAILIDLTEHHPILAGIVWVLLSLVGIMGLGMIALGVWLAILIANPPNHQSLAGWELAFAVFMTTTAIAAGLAVATLPIWAMHQNRRQQDQQRYVADTWGLRRGTKRYHEHIAWHEVRSFFRITDGHTTDVAELLATPNVEKRMRQVDDQAKERVRRYADRMAAVVNRNLSVNYVLDAGEHVWTWSVTPRAASRQAAVYDQLWGLIVTRTQQPLRDLTRPAERIVHAATSEAPAAVAPRGVSNTDMAPAAIAPATSSGHSTRAARSKRWGCVITLAPIIAVLVFCGGGWGLQQYQRALYGGLPARIHAQAPLFADALVADDGLWPVHAATADDAAYGYVNGVYQISGNGGEATLDRQYGDVTVEVTVQQWPSNMNEKMGDLGQIGLVLRATDSPAGVVTFTIGPLGNWALMRYREWGPDAGQWQVLGIGEHNGAIHQGFVRNRLLVLMRGSEYVCFVNDQLVAVVHDDALAVGQMGLWLDDNTTIGRYSNFAVYPAV